MFGDYSQHIFGNQLLLVKGWGQGISSHHNTDFAPEKEVFAPKMPTGLLSIQFYRKHIL